MLHGAGFGEEAGARNRVFFPCKVAAAGDGRYLVCVCESNPVPKGGSFFAIFVVRFFRPMIKTGGLPDL